MVLAVDVAVAQNRDAGGREGERPRREPPTWDELQERIAEMRANMDRRQHELDEEIERRQNDEGEHFDPADAQFRRDMHSKHRALMERRIALMEGRHQAHKVADNDFRQGMQELRAERKSLRAQARAHRDQRHQQHMAKRRDEMERRQQEFETEIERRLQEDEGFTEADAQAERDRHARHRELEERQLAIDEAAHNEHQNAQSQEEHDAIEARRHEQQQLDAERDKLYEEGVSIQSGDSIYSKGELDTK